VKDKQNWSAIAVRERSICCDLAPMEKRRHTISNCRPTWFPKPDTQERSVEGDHASGCNWQPSKKATQRHFPCAPSQDSERGHPAAELHYVVGRIAKGLR
jgi:hypothetical protein